MWQWSWSRVPKWRTKERPITFLNILILSLLQREGKRGWRQGKASCEWGIKWLHRDRPLSSDSSEFINYVVFFCVCIVYFDWYSCFWSYRAKSSVWVLYGWSVMQPSASRSMTHFVPYIITDYGMYEFNAVHVSKYISSYLKYSFGILTGIWSPSFLVKALRILVPYPKM